MANNKKILIVENQSREYRSLFDLLSIEYEVFPKKCDYVKFIDPVRVYLNPRYGERRKLALESVLKDIETYDPDLMIVDHILVGNDDAQTGIDLVLKIREKNSTPVLFLSRTERNHVDVCMKLPLVIPTETVTWAPKGYSGVDRDDKAFFEKIVLPEVKILIDKKKKKLSLLEEVKLSFADMCGQKNVTDKQKELHKYIYLFLDKYGDGSSSEIDQICSNIISKRTDVELIKYLRSICDV